MLDVNELEDHRNGKIFLMLFKVALEEKVLNENSALIEDKIAVVSSEEEEAKSELIYFLSKVPERAKEKCLNNDCIF